MDQLILEELRRANANLTEYNKGLDMKSIKDKEMHLQDAIREILRLDKLARDEGLLVLEEILEAKDSSEMKAYLKQMIGYVIDGYDREDIINNVMARYYGIQFDPYEAIEYLILLTGMLSIQAGEASRVIEEKLKCFLPDRIFKEYSLKQKEEIERIKKQKADTIVERLCQEKPFWKQEQDGYFLLKLMDYLLQDMSDQEIQCMLRHIDDKTLAFAMKGMGGTARKRIFDNVTKQLAKEIAENMEYMGPMRACDIIDETQRIIHAILELMQSGELNDKFMYLKPFEEMLTVKNRRNAG